MKTLTVAAALTALAVAYIARVQGLLSDGFVLESLVVTGYLVVCWASGIGATEAYKRRWVPRPWALKPGMSATEIQAVDRAQDTIWIAATIAGGVPFAALLLARYWPPTVEGALLMVLGGLGIGGGILPYVYRFIASTLWPLAQRALRAVKFVRRVDGVVEERPADQPSGDGEKTLLPDFVGSATEVPDALKPSDQTEPSDGGPR